MSRSFGGEDWDEARQALWDNAVRRATYSQRGQQALRGLEAALLALPEKRLIEGLISDGTGVCAVGAIAAHRQVLGGSTWSEAFKALDESDEYEPDEGYSPSIDDTARFAEQQLRMAFSLAWEMAYRNDHLYEGMVPEKRYERVLIWVQNLIQPTAPQQADLGPREGRAG